MKTIYHRDGTITYWSVYRQAWIDRATEISDRELAAMGSIERERVIRHLDIVDIGEKIEIKRDIDGYVVYVDGRIHPRGTGFVTKRAAMDWAISTRGNR